MPAGGNVLERVGDRGRGACGEDRRDGADVHHVDHRNGGVRFGERRHDGSEGARAEPGPAMLG